MMSASTNNYVVINSKAVKVAPNAPAAGGSGNLKNRHPGLVTVTPTSNPSTKSCLYFLIDSLEIISYIINGCLNSTFLL